jgi:hypothetical protein
MPLHQLEYALLNRDRSQQQLAAIHLPATEFVPQSEQAGMLSHMAANFPDECRYVLETLSRVYDLDAKACERGLSPKNRLRFRQQRSGPVMDELHGWKN